MMFMCMNTCLFEMHGLNYLGGSVAARGHAHGSSMSWYRFIHA